MRKMKLNEKEKIEDLITKILLNGNKKLNDYKVIFDDCYTLRIISKEKLTDITNVFYGELIRFLNKLDFSVLNIYFNVNEKTIEIFFNVPLEIKWVD